MSRLGPDYKETVRRDGLVRADTTIEKPLPLSRCSNRKYGTITAGNSSPLTDGGSAVVLMSEERAKQLGFEPLAFVRSWPSRVSTRAGSS